MNNSPPDPKKNGINKDQNHNRYISWFSNYLPQNLTFFQPNQNKSVPTNQNPTTVPLPIVQNTTPPQNDGTTGYSIWVKCGIAAFFLGHGVIIASLIPVLRMRGAPYLPTFKKGLNTMFEAVDKHVPNVHNKTLIDLGKN